MRAQPQSLKYSGAAVDSPGRFNGPEFMALDIMHDGRCVRARPPRLPGTGDLYARKRKVFLACLVENFNMLRYILYSIRVSGVVDMFVYVSLFVRW